GKCYEQLGDSERQYAAYQRVLALDPLSPAAHLGMGAARLAQGQLDKAIEEYRKLPGGTLIVARLLTGRNVQRAGGEKRWEEVEQGLREAPDSPERAIAQAELLTANKKLQQAYNLLAAARQKEPKNVDLRVALATLAQRQEKWDKALSLLDEAE